MQPLYMLVDCNNFFVSCERIFQPKLEGVPVVVLSNNDGCVIARSQEAKDLGIKMAQPVFQIKDLIHKQRVHVFSSNYVLYGDLSNRLSQILESLGEEVENYSIDEAFLKIYPMEKYDAADYALYIKNKIYQDLGLPVSIGIGKTKTLAKIANGYAKKNQSLTNGIYDVSETTVQNWLLPKVSVNDVWGIGRRWSKQLNEFGIKTAQDLKVANQRWIRDKFNIIMQKTVLELNDFPVIDLQTQAVKRKEIVCSRSFGESQLSYESLRSAVAYHTSAAAVKLRKQSSVSQNIYVFIRTNPFNSNDKQYSNGYHIALMEPTDDTGILIEHAVRGLKMIFKTDFKYKKAGIMLYNLYDSHTFQPSLLQTTWKTNIKLMQALDTINNRYGKGTLVYGAEGFEHQWAMQRQLLSESYTTSWDHLPLVKAH